MTTQKDADGAPYGGHQMTGRDRFQVRGRFRRAKGQPAKRREQGEMNNTEAKYAEVLDARIASGEVLGWRYERVTFRLAKRTSYTPDFTVQMADGTWEVHEVKACNANGSFRAEDDAKVKIKVAAEMFPEYRWVLCGAIQKRQGGGWRFEEVG